MPVCYCAAFTTTFDQVKVSRCDLDEAETEYNYAETMYDCKGTLTIQSGKSIFSAFSMNIYKFNISMISDLCHTVGNQTAAQNNNLTSKTHLFGR